MGRRIRWPRTPDCCRPIGSLSKAAFQELKSRIWCSSRRMCIVPPQQLSYLFDNGHQDIFCQEGGEFASIHSIAEKGSSQEPLGAGQGLRLQVFLHSPFGPSLSVPVTVLRYHERLQDSHRRIALANAGCLFALRPLAWSLINRLASAGGPACATSSPPQPREARSGRRGTTGTTTPRQGAPSR